MLTLRVPSFRRAALLVLPLLMAVVILKLAHDGVGSIHTCGGRS